MIPVLWLARDHTCARCRWDEQFVDDLISGRMKRPGSWWPAVEHVTTNYIEPGDFAIVCFPAGAHQPDTVAWLNRQLRKLRRVVLFITSDEASTFPVHLITHPSMDLWVMEPRPELPYPEGTVFIGCGSARAGLSARPYLEVDRDVWFSGQANHDRRDQMVRAMRSAGWPARVTDGFLEGVDRTVYLEELNSTRFAPCPAGVQSQDSFRLHEALELGALPLADAFRPDGGGEGYWALTMPSAPFPIVRNWSDLPRIIDELGPGWPQLAVASHSWWHLRRRDLATHLRDQLGAGPGDEMTVIIPTSPIRSHPDTRILEETVASVRERTVAEILITMDGVREEQQDLADAYAAYRRRVCLLAERWDNVTPVYHSRHRHQAEMLRRALELIETPYIMYVEHDTPLINEISIPSVIDTMREEGLNLMRFYHESAIHPDHMHLMVDKVDGWRQTLQWSQRPHIARTSWYRRLLRRIFDSTARTMIEDVMFGVVEHDQLTMGSEAAWKKWRLGIWEPHGPTIQRSTHLDGRGDEPKYGMRFRYPNGDRPPGSPHPSTNGL